MKKVKNGWIIKKGWVIKALNGEYLLNDLDNAFGEIFDAHVFKLKRDAREDIDNSGEAGETIEKVEITKIVKMS